MSEVWKPVPDYEGLYEVSNYGRVKSLFRYKRIMTSSPNKGNGYLYVQLFKNKKGKNFAIHRLVAMCFCDNPENKPFVNHKDETRTNNHADNLEWVTHKENCNYGTAIKRRVQHTDFANRKIDRSKQAAAVSKPILQYTKDGKFVRAWKSASECSRKTGISISGIRCVARGKRNSVYGYIFKERGDDLSHA